MSQTSKPRSIMRNLVEAHRSSLNANAAEHLQTGCVSSAVGFVAATIWLIRVQDLQRRMKEAKDERNRRMPRTSS